MRLRGKKVLFSRADTFSLDNTLSPIIAAGLSKFLEVLEDPSCFGGCPSALTHPETLDKLKIPSKVYNHLPLDKDEWGCYSVDVGVVVWHWMLREMIWAFSADLDEENIYYKDYIKNITVTFTDSAGGRIVSAESDKYLAAMTYWAEACLTTRYERAMSYFAKFYKSLWW